MSPRPRTALRARCLALLLCACVLPLSGTATAQPTFGEVLAALVGVHTRVPDTARTAETLGSERWGSGVVIDDQGLVLTIGYLLLEAHTVEVRLQDGRIVPGEIVAYDHDTGFGLLRSEAARGVLPLALGQSGGLDAEEPVLAISHGGREFVVPAVVVARQVFAGNWEYLLENAIFTSPPHPVFSGAALVGAQGELLGIGSLRVDAALSGHGLVPANMFVPIDTLKPILDDLLRHGRNAAPPRPWLGLYTREAHGQLEVVRVAEASPADAAGIRPGDMLVGIAGQATPSLESFYRKLWSLGPAGTVVRLQLRQGGALTEIAVTSIDRYRWLGMGRKDSETR